MLRPALCPRSAYSPPPPRPRPILSQPAVLLPPTRPVGPPAAVPAAIFRAVGEGVYAAGHDGEAGDGGREVVRERRGVACERLRPAPHVGEPPGLPPRLALRRRPAPRNAERGQDE